MLKIIAERTAGVSVDKRYYDLIDADGRNRKSTERTSDEIISSICSTLNQLGKEDKQ